MEIEILGETLLVVNVAAEPETERVGRALAAIVEPGTVIGLIGPLGAGKTRLSRDRRVVGGRSPAIASPTFVLIHEYEGRFPVYHFDAYRLPSADAFDALGASDYWAGDGVCLVEWADRVRDRLPSDAWTVRIELIGLEARRLDDRPAESARSGQTIERLAGDGLTSLKASPTFWARPPF